MLCAFALGVFNRYKALPALSSGEEHWICAYCRCPSRTYKLESLESRKIITRAFYTNLEDTFASRVSTQDL